MALATFVWDVVPGDIARVDLPLFSFSIEPFALALLAGGSGGRECVFVFVLDNLCIGANRFASAASASPSVCKGLNSGLSGELASIRMRLSGLGFTGEYACVMRDARGFAIGKGRLPTGGVCGRANSAFCDKAGLSTNVGSELVVWDDEEGSVVLCVGVF